MKCVVNDATSGGGATNSLISNLPSLIFDTIAFFVFAYIVIGLIHVFQAARAGEEITHLIIPPLAAFAGIALVMIFQNILFSGDRSC